MADLSTLLSVLEHDPDDPQALAALPDAARVTSVDERTTRFAVARKLLAGRGRPDTVAYVLDAEIAATDAAERKADLLLEKGMVLDGDLLDVAGARRAFAEVLALRANDPLATDALEELGVAEKNWQKFAAKYLKEAGASTDRSLATGLYASAAEAYIRFAPSGTEAEQYLNKALEIDPGNAKAAFHLARLYERAGRWSDLAELHEQRAEHGVTEDRVAALVALAELAKTHLPDAARAERALARALALDPSHPRALRLVTDAAAGAGDWRAVIATYQTALKARRDGDDLGMLLQIAMALWKHVGDLEQAEEYFRRVRKLEPGHPAALDFYRAYYTEKGESGKLMALLKSVEKGAAPRARSESGKLSVEIAELAEAQHNPEKAIEAWKQALRQDPASAQARAALARLYRRTEKWNALLDLMKDELERLPAGDVAARVAKLFEIAEVYRDRLRLDVMVINYYNAILKIDPDNARASDELAAKYRALGRWNDLISILTRKAEAAELPGAVRIQLLREIADLWSERFGNFANAIKPLEQIIELDPTDGDAVSRLKQIYSKRRQWRQLIDLLGREASGLPAEERRAKQAEMARLAAERLGDARLAIEIYNRILASEGDTPEALAALAALYEREKRYLAFAEILHRQAAAARGQAAAAQGKEAIALYEKLGQIYADRLSAPQQAAAAWICVLDIEPNHAKALRTLRELYAMAGDFAGLEALYARLGQQEELVDALLAIADRIEAKATRLPLVERAAQLAQERAEKGAEGQRNNAIERARQVWERVLAIEPQHVAAAAALAPIYEQQEKWARLLAVREIELAAAPDTAARLAKIAQIRQLCEQRLASKNLAFQWTVRAFDLDQTSTALYGDLLRLASEPAQWRELAACFERALAGGALPPAGRLGVLRELAKIASKRLGDPEKARAYHRRVLELAPDDHDAEAALEELAVAVADWPALLASYRRRAARTSDKTARAALLVDVAELQEQKLVDLDGAAAAYYEALEVQPGLPRALRALARIEEARGDWPSLAGVLALQLQQTTDGVQKVELMMRLGQLYDGSLDDPARALGFYRDALAAPESAGRARPRALEAVARLVLGAGAGAKRLAPDVRVAAARQILPYLEAAHDFAQRAQVLEVLRAAADTSPAERIELDRALMRLYHIDLGDPASSWQAGLRVLAAEPTDGDVRAALAVLAGQLGRDGEWAHHLTAALGAVKAQDVAPAHIRAIATELAVLAGERLEDDATAERAWLDVLEVEADAADAFDALAASYRAAQRWTDLRALLARRADVTIDRETRRAALLELARLEEGTLHEAARAIAAYRRVLDLDGGNDDAFAALDRLYTEAKSWPELEELLARRVDQLDDGMALRELALRRAQLFAHQLAQPARAVDLLEDVVARHPHHDDARELLEELLTSPSAGEVTMRIARLLEPLYERDKLWRDLLGVLRVQRSLTTGTEAVELLARIAALAETELGAASAAFDAWLEVLRLEPAHERARGELARLAQWLGRWPDAAAALEAAAAATPEGDLVTRAALLGDLAGYYEERLGDADRAIAAYQRLLEVDPTSPTTIRRAGGALARLYEERSRWSELRGVLRRQADWADDAGERRALLARVAALDEERLADRAAAIATWNDVLLDDPSDAGALHALERLYAADGRWRDLIDVLRRMIDHAAGDAEAIALLARIAQTLERQLGEPEEAIAAWLEVLDRDPHDATAQGELARMYRAAGRDVDLLDVLERQLHTAAAPARAALHVEIARLLQGALGRPMEALERWAAVLRDDPREATARAAVEAALGDIDLRLFAADILRPVYAAAGEDAQLAGLLLRQAEWTDEPAAKVRLLGEVVRLREQRLGDKPGALEAQLAALRHAAHESDLARVLAEADRLAAELGREADLIDPYRAIAPDVLDADIQRRLYLDIADLSRAVRHDLDAARDYYQRVLDGQPDDARALAALESIHRDTGDTEHLVEILLRQAEAGGGDVDSRIGALLEAAGLYKQLGRADDAVEIWERVMELAPERGDAVYALEKLYGEHGRWHDLAELYERRLGFVTSIEEAVALRVELGELFETKLRDPEAAVEHYAAALSGNQRQPAAIAALERYLVDPVARATAATVLEPIYVGQHRWHDLIRVYEARLDEASDPDERLRLTRFVARLYEEQLEDFEQASRWYANVFAEAPGDVTIRDQLERLASVLENWGFVAETYQRFLDDEAGDAPPVRAIAVAAGEIYDRRMADFARAYAAYRRALGIEPEGEPPPARELVRRLEELCGRAQRWDDLVAAYDDVIVRGDDELRRETLMMRARLLEHRVGDAGRAIDGWREVVLATEAAETPLELAAYREAVAELERLLRGAARWRDVVDLLEARIERATQVVELADLRIKLAEVFEAELADVTAAIDQYEEVLQAGTGWDRAVAALERLVVHDDHRERIVGLLEPVYREHDWWQKLVVILDAKLEYVDDPAVQAATLHEIAQLHDARGGALDLALAALARAWRIDPADDEALGRLLALAGKLGAWDEAVRTVEDGAASAQDRELAATLWARAAELHESQRSDLAAAIAAWRKVDEARPDDLVALAALDRLLALESRTAELVTVVERRADLAEDAGVRLVLLHRVGGLYEEVLGDRPRAIAAFKSVLEVDDTDVPALDALVRLYRSTGEARDLVEVLERKIALATDPDVRRALRRDAANVCEGQLSDVYQAIEYLTAVLDEDAGDAGALAELDRIYAKQALWPELLDVVDRRALLAATAPDRAELAYRAARLVETELADPDAAIPRYGAVLQILPGHEAARAALETMMAKDDLALAVSTVLERVYRAERDAAGLIRVYERRLALPGRDRETRRTDWQALADVRETMANQPVQAFVVWGRALADDPEDTELLEPLERLAESQRLWRELAALIDDRFAEGAEPLPPDLEQGYAMRLGQIADERLGDLERAARAYERASHGPEPRPALAALERVLGRAGNWKELAGVLRRRADAAGDDREIAALLARLGELQETTLQAPEAAVAAYSGALAVAPDHPEARAALERMLTGGTAPGVRREIVDILEPLYEQDGDAARLVAALDARLSVTQDPLDRASVLARQVELAEQKLGDRAKALDAALRWLEVDPASGQALAETERLAERLGQWRETASRVDAIVHAPAALDREPDVQVGLLVFLGRILRERLGHNEDATRIFRAALGIEPDSLAALDPLVDLLRQRGEAGALADALRQRAGIVRDLRERRAALAEVAQLAERAGDLAGAARAWSEVVEQDDGDREALDELARLHRATGDRAALIEVLARAARLASDDDDARRLRFEIAQLEDDGPHAVAAWTAVVDLAPEDPSALAALEAAHARAGDWLAVADVQTRRLDLAPSAHDKIAIYAEMAKLAETRRSSIDDAIAAWYAALDLDRAYVAGYDELERLLGAAGRWHDLVELLESRAELHATLGDGRAEIAALARAADVWEARLDDPSAAGEILEKILAREPGSVAALTRLSKIYERSGDWEKCKQTLEQALRAGPRGDDAADLFFRLGEVARVGDHDADTAVQHFRQVLQHRADHAGAIAALEQLARDRRDAPLLADMLARRVAAIAEPEAQVPLLVELAELERKAGKNDAALAALARAANAAPDDVRVLGPLADLFVLVGRPDEAAPIYEQLARDAKAARRMKDVARYRQRQGHILEMRGDTAGALVAYEEALRVNPTDVVTMTGLGRMYFNRGEWEKARKIYQSLVLQNIDPDAGLTKGEVYWALGKINIELGQAQKAKSMFQRGLELEPQNPKLQEALSSLR